LRIKWTRPALTDFAEAQDYIAVDNPQAAAQIAQRIRDSVRKLREFPYIGRPGDDLQTREWHVQRTPYLLVYRLREDVIEIVRIWHGRRDPQSKPPVEAGG
jgi:addiction module RelE/StbE family toxin